MGLSVGSTLGGRYELIRQLGSGGMGVVWLAKHRELGTLVAIKALKPEVMSDQEAVTRFDREARAAASLRGPHVARILDVGRSDDVPFMVMEYLEGNDLGAELVSAGALPIADAVNYVQQACEGMSEAHQRGIIHRDLKPENLFLARSGDARVVKILDFGISRVAGTGETRVTQTQSSFGTPLYMSPEQVRSTKNVDHRTDIWSLGVIFYELVAGEPPFSGETPTAVAVAITIDRLVPLREKRPDVPAALDAIVSRALDRDPAKRFGSMEELGAALEPFRGVESAPFSRPRFSALSGMPGPTRPDAATSSKTLRVSNTEVPARVAARRAAPTWLVGVAAGLAVACAIAAIIAFRRPAASGDPGESRVARPSLSGEPSSREAPVERAPITAEASRPAEVAPSRVEVVPSASASAPARPASTTSKPVTKPPAPVSTSGVAPTSAPPIPPPVPQQAAAPPLHL